MLSSKEASFLEVYAPSRCTTCTLVSRHRNVPVLQNNNGMLLFVRCRLPIRDLGLLTRSHTIAPVPRGLHAVSEKRTELFAEGSTSAAYKEVWCTYVCSYMHEVHQLKRQWKSML